MWLQGQRGHKRWSCGAAPRAVSERVCGVQPPHSQDFRAVKIARCSFRGRDSATNKPRNWFQTCRSAFRHEPCAPIRRHTGNPFIRLGYGDRFARGSCGACRRVLSAQVSKSQNASWWERVDVKRFFFAQFVWCYKTVCCAAIRCQSRRLCACGIGCRVVNVLFRRVVVLR